MRYVTLVSLPLVALASAASAAEEVFLSSPPYDILVSFEYTDEADPYGSQGYIASYRAVSMFSHVSFGASFSPVFPAMFATTEGPSGMGGVMPSIQISGSGVIEHFTLQPAWESDDEAIEAEVTHGPEPFDPTLTLLTEEQAMDSQECGEDDMPLVPLVQTLWFLFNEGYSIAEPELQWRYPEFAESCIESGAVIFPVPLAKLGEGEPCEMLIPYEGGTARGTWTIRFMPVD